jgi:hypothetical protein
MVDPRSGGALRSRVTTALAMPLDAVSKPGNMRRVVLTSSERDVAALTAQLDAAAKALGPDIDLALRLEAQLDPTDLGRLREHGRKLKTWHRPAARSRMVLRHLRYRHIGTSRRPWRARCAMAVFRSCW